MNLTDVAANKRTRFTVLGGPSFFGFMREIPDTTRVSNLDHNRRVLQVSPKSIVKSTDIIKTNQGVMFLVADHGDGYSAGIFYRQFKLFEINRTYNWKRKVTVVDSVTGLVMDSSYTDMGNIYCAEQPERQLTDTLNIPEPTVSLLVGKAVQIDDKINNQTVTRVTQELGVYVVETK